MPVAKHTDPLKPFIIDCKALLGGNHRAAYLKSSITVKGSQTAILAIGSAGSIKAWLNNRLVLDHQTYQRLVPDQATVSVHLQDGRNDLMIKIAGGEDGWSRSFP